MNNSIKQITTTLKYTTLAASIVLLTSCAATEVALSHKNLDTQTKLSKTIFLDPVADSQKTVFLVVKNTSDQDINITSALKSSFQMQGYRVMNAPASAHYMLQVNVLSASKMSKSASEKALGGGFGSAVAGGLTGATVGSFSGNSNVALAGGLVGGVAGLVADSLVKNVNYTLITDIKITEHKKGHDAHFKTRIVSEANQVNLSFDKAKPMLEKGLVRTLVGIF